MEPIMPDAALLALLDGVRSAQATLDHVKDADFRIVVDRGGDRPHGAFQAARAALTGLQDAVAARASSLGRWTLTWDSGEVDVYETREAAEEGAKAHGDPDRDFARLRGPGFDDADQGHAASIV